MNSINRTFRIVFEPYQRHLHDNKRRFAVGGKSLPKYIGEKNAKTAVERALGTDQDKYRVKLRKHGIVDFYFK